VIDSSVAAIIANVLVRASGRNIRPSCASSRNTGVNDTMMMSSEKKSGRPTCVAASTMTRVLLAGSSGGGVPSGAGSVSRR
jgi:hypothetical protein